MTCACTYLAARLEGASHDSRVVIMPGRPYWVLDGLLKKLRFGY